MNTTMKKIIVFALIVLTTFHTSVPVWAATVKKGETVTVPDGTYIIRSAVDDKMVVDAYGAVEIQSGTNIQLCGYNGGDNQIYEITGVGGGWYKIICKYDHKKALDIYGGIARSENNVLLWDYHGGANQLWRFVSAGNGYYYIQSKLGNYYLDLYRGVAVDEQNLQIYKLNGGTNQQWKLERVETAYNPQGSFDALTSDKTGEITLTGFAFDRDNQKESLSIHVYVGGPAGIGDGAWIGTADKYSAGVNEVHCLEGNHAFKFTVSTERIGVQPVYVYAINVGGGTENTLIGKRDVYIQSNEEVKRRVAVSYMLKMATIPWTPKTTFKHWSYYSANGNSFEWQKNTVYYGIPYSQSTRTTSLDEFRSNLSGGTYVGPAGMSTYKGSDCSSAVSLAYRQVNPNFPITWTGGLFPSCSYMAKVGEYQDYGWDNTYSICQSNKMDVMKRSYAKLQPGDLLLSHCGSRQHVVMVTEVGNGYVKVTHQTTFDSKLKSTWGVNEKITYDELFSQSYIPVTLKTW